MASVVAGWLFGGAANLAAADLPSGDEAAESVATKAASDGDAMVMARDDLPPAPKVERTTKPSVEGHPHVIAPSEIPPGHAFDVMVRLPSSMTSLEDVLIRAQRSDADAPLRALRVRRVGTRAFAARVPATMVAPPGLRLVVERPRAEGEDDDDAFARRIATGLVEVPTDEERLERTWMMSEIRAGFEHVDSNRFRGDDHFSRAWGMGSVRFGEHALRRVGVGYTFIRAVVRGREGGEVRPARDTLAVAFFDVEIEAQRFLRLHLRPILGRRADRAAGGLRAGFNIGPDLGTQFELAAEVIAHWGGLAIVRADILALNPWRFRIEGQLGRPFAWISNDAGGSSFWGRGTAEVGYRFHPAVETSVRMSGQGRGGDHFGFGAGTGVSLRW
ncbi:MAG: hypothetical protein AAF715_14635 [Myxococcota bacterium]